jgi:DNA-directed RNA polymerase specialized sigma24 family protein
MSDVTRILNAVEQGDPKAAEELLPLVYDELRRLAAAKMANEKPGQTLQPKALVHEAWVRLLGLAQEPRRGKAGAIFSEQPRKPCGGSSWTTPGASSV